jgi:hypothetical protein
VGVPIIRRRSGAPLLYKTKPQPSSFRNERKVQS